MTRFNLNEAALLDVSGELGHKASAQLREHLRADMRARADAEEIGAAFAMLQSQVKPLPEGQVTRIGDQLKQAVRQDLRKLKRAKESAVRRRFIYGALAGVSGVAACLVIALTIAVVVRNRANKRELAITKAEDSIRDFMNADADNMTDVSLASLNKQINTANDLQDQWSPTENSGNRARLLELVDPTPDEDINDTGT